MINLFTSRRRVLAGLAAVATTATVLAGCADPAQSGGGASASGSGAGGDQAIGVTLIVKTTTNPFFVTMQEGAKEAAQKDNINLTLAAGKEDGDEDSQIQAIENAISRGDKGILITPNGPAVVDAIDKARQQGLYVIALDTPPDPADAVDITFATDNFEAGKLIGEWAAAKMDGKKAVIGLVDLNADKVISVDVKRDQGFLTGMGIDTKDVNKNGDEDKTGKYTGGKGGDYEIAGSQPSMGAEDGGRTAMETLLSKNSNINLVYTINEPAAYGAYQALQAAGKDKDTVIVSVDGGCAGVDNVKKGIIGATSQQYPLKMAQLGVEAIGKIARGGEKPQVSQGLDFYNTGVKLVTDEKMSGVDGIDTTEGAKLCWGTK